MNLSAYIIEAINESSLKLSDEDRERLLQLDKEFLQWYSHYKDNIHRKDVVNMDSEFDKFIKAYKRGEKYFPKLKFQRTKVTYNDVTMGYELIKKFKDFKNCYFSKFYIQMIGSGLASMEHALFHKDGVKSTLWNSSLYVLDKDTIEAAKQCAKDNPYEKVENDRTRDADYAEEYISKAIKELGYDWKVIQASDMLPRMNVAINGTLRINKDAKFSDADLEGLVAHEVKGHVGRRYYGKQTGLGLMLVGLPGRNVYDEGLAVWNSLNIVEHDKPNVLHNIAIKYLIAAYCDTYDFCDLFKFIRKFTKMPDVKIFSAIVRCKRDLVDMSIRGGSYDDAHYFYGYRLVDKMTDKDRDDILKYNVGPQEWKELDKIKTFLKVNKFNKNGE